MSGLDPTKYTGFSTTIDFNGINNQQENTFGSTQYPSMMNSKQVLDNLQNQNFGNTCVTNQSQNSYMMKTQMPNQSQNSYMMKTQMVNQNQNYGQMPNPNQNLSQMNINNPNQFYEQTNNPNQFYEQMNNPNQFYGQRNNNNLPEFQPMSNSNQQQNYRQMPNPNQFYGQINNNNNSIQSQNYGQMNINNPPEFQPMPNQSSIGELSSGFTLSQTQNESFKQLNIQLPSIDFELLTTSMNYYNKSNDDMVESLQKTHDKTFESLIQLLTYSKSMIENLTNENKKLQDELRIKNFGEIKQLDIKSDDIKQLDQTPTFLVVNTLDSNVLQDIKPLDNQIESPKNKSPVIKEKEKIFELVPNPLEESKTKKQKEVKVEKKFQFTDMTTDFEENITKYLKHRKIMKGIPDVLVKIDNTTKMSHYEINKQLKGKKNVVMVILTENNIYCASFSKFSKNFDNKHWMKDEEYRLYSLFKNKKENFCVWKRVNEEDDDDDELTDACYQFGSEHSDSKVIIQLFSAFEIDTTKTMHWYDDSFDEFYECQNEKGEARDEKIFSKKTEKTKEILFIQFE